MKNQKDRTLKSQLSRLVEVLYASGNQYKGRDGAKGKKKHLTVDITMDKSKV